MLLPAWERGRTALAGDRPAFASPPHYQNHYQPYRALNCSRRHWCFVDVSYLPASPSQASQTLWGFKNDSREEQWTVWQEDGGRTSRGCGVEGCSVASAPTTLNPPWHHPCTCGEKNVKKEKGRTERRFSNQTISHFMCGSPLLPLFLSSLHLTLSPFSSL